MFYSRNLASFTDLSEILHLDAGSYFLFGRHLIFNVFQSADLYGTQGHCTSCVTHM